MYTFTNPGTCTHAHTHKYIIFIVFPQQWFANAPHCSKVYVHYLSCYLRRRALNTRIDHCDVTTVYYVISLPFYNIKWKLTLDIFTLFVLHTVVYVSGKTIWGPKLIKMAFIKSISASHKTIRYKDNFGGVLQRSYLCTKCSVSCRYTHTKYSRTSNNGHCRGIQILSVIGGVR
jgi:hypothetical protein